MPTIEIISPNFIRVEIGAMTLFFSYRELIAFIVGGHVTIKQNGNGTTTGKHLNYINPDKTVRVTHEDFMREWMRVERLHLLSGR